MDVDTALGLRAVERMVIELGGILSIFLGALLFRWGYLAPADIELEREKSRLSMKNAAPGLFFAMFGAVILLMGLFMPLDIPAPPDPTADPPAEGRQRITYSVVGDEDELQAFLDSVIATKEAIVDGGGTAQNALEALSNLAAQAERLRAARPKGDG